MSPLEKRRVATEATLAKFSAATFDWAGSTCVHMAAAQLRAMGHAVPRVPRFRTALGARRAMKKRGWGTVAAMLDAVLPGARIAPAMMLVGDLAVVEGQDGIDAIFICAGPLKLFGWREDAEGVVVLDVSLDQVTGAWRL